MLTTSHITSQKAELTSWSAGHTQSVADGRTDRIWLQRSHLQYEEMVETQDYFVTIKHGGEAWIVIVFLSSAYLSYIISVN